MRGKVIRFVCYGLLGWCFEVVWTAVAMKICGDVKDWSLRGHTYVWMLLIYGLIAPLFEPAHNALRRRFWLVRAVIYGAGFLAVEYITGWILLKATGNCPWDYSGYTQWHIHGLIRLDAFPVWALVGMGCERLQDFLVRLTPAMEEALGFAQRGRGKQPTPAE